jgi:predicted cupin superfamily sugar epimerase
MDAEAIVQALDLSPHPEGGFYRETWRGRHQVTGRSHGKDVERAASTAIYFLLPFQTFSAFHRVSSDEVWHHYDGVPLELHVIDDHGRHERFVLGNDLAKGERPQFVVPADVWQAAAPVGRGHVLVGCTVAPGFDFADFELPSRASLEARFPQHAALVKRFTRV